MLFGAKTEKIGNVIKAGANAESNATDPQELSPPVTGAQEPGAVEPAAKPETKPGHAGIGLANTRARLQQLYGNAQSLVAGPGELGGWTVTITIPFQPAPVRRSLT